MKKVSQKLRVTELDTITSTLIRLYEADASIAEDAFMKMTMAELTGLSGRLTESIKRKRINYKLCEADNARDQVIRDLGTLIEGYTAIPFEAQKASAEKLNAVFGRYGKMIVNETYATESSLIESLLIDLKAPELAEHIARLPGVAELMDRLRRAQDDFLVVSDLQTEAAADRQPCATSLSKEILAKINDQLIPYMNVMTMANANVFGTFIKQVEIEIGRINDSVTRRKPSKSAAPTD